MALLGPNERGLILRAKYRNTGSPKDGLENYFQSIDPSWWRFALIFFELIDLPSTTNTTHFNDDEKFLLSTSALTRTWYHADYLNITAEQAHKIYVDHELSEPGQWCISSPFYEPPSPPEIDSDRSLMVRLYQSIPIPHRDVPYADILEFRERRRDERYALRAHIESLYEAIISAGDGPLMLRTQLQRLEQSVAEEMAVLDEAGFRIALGGLEAHLNWEFDLKLPLIGGGIGASAGETGLILGAGLGALGNLIPKIELSTKLGKRRGTINHRPFEYVLRIGEEL